MMTARQRLYLTADKKRLVANGDRRAAILYAVPGDLIPDSAAERFGLVDGALPEKKGGKSKDAPPNKEKAPGQDKGGGADDDKGKAPAGGEGAGDGPRLTDVKGLGASTAKELVKAGVVSVADLAAVDPANPPQLTGWRGIPKWAEWVAGAKARLAPAEAV